MRPPLKIQVPEPLRAADKPSFTHDSVVIRLPDIARRTLAENDFPPETVAAIQSLIQEIPHAPVRLLKVPASNVVAAWNEYVRPYIGQDWLQVPWFFAEEYFYMRILEATGYFAPGPGRLQDPYLHQKKLGLESTRPAIAVLARQVTAAIFNPTETYLDSLARLVLVDLWGNQNDLSMWPVSLDEDGGGHQGGSAGEPVDEGASVSSQAIHSAETHILANDLSSLRDYLARIPAGELRVDILLDNAGYELVADLALADFLISTGLAAQVVLHTKTHPVFVSDALEKDVHETIDFMAFDTHSPSQALAVRLRRRLVDERLIIQSHPFWTSPLAMWDLPEDLYKNLQHSHLLISKGDANYRRLLGDRHWPVDVPFHEVVNYLPCAILSLRTLKSEIAVGIDPNRAPTHDPDWMINGRWGLVQFAPPDPSYAVSPNT